MVPVSAFAEDVRVGVRMDDDVRVLCPAMDMVVDVDMLVLVGAQQGVVNDEDGAGRHHQQGDAELHREAFAQKGKREKRPDKGRDRSRIGATMSSATMPAAKGRSPRERRFSLRSPLKRKRYRKPTPCPAPT